MNKMRLIALVTLGLLTVAALVLRGEPMAVADPGFNPEAAFSLSDNSTCANADITSEFGIPEGDGNFEAAVFFIPGDPDDPAKGFFIAAGDDIPDGTEVGEVSGMATVGLLNGPCSNSLFATFTLLDASLDTSDTITFEDQFGDTNGNGIPDGAEKYPEFLNTMYPGMTPWARMFGATSLPGGPDVSLNYVVFAPGHMAGFSADWGYPSVTVLQDPTAPLQPNPINDFCTPLMSDKTVYGLADGLPYRANPCAPGTYTFRSHSRGLPDTDGDGFENDFDTCPYDLNKGDARLPHTAGGGDGAAECDGHEEATLYSDGIDCACDPDPDLPSLLDKKHCWPGSPGGDAHDCDGDGYQNRQDNCPLDFNPGQGDTDGDGIGDPCDIDGVAPRPEVTIEEGVDITGPDADGDGLLDSFEDGFGGEGITIMNADSDPPNRASSTGDAASGSTITTGELTVTLPPGTTTTTEIEVKFVSDGPGPGVNPKVEISGVSLPAGTTKSVELPFGDQNAVCMDDRPEAEIETVDVGDCESPKVELGIPELGDPPNEVSATTADGVATTYTVTRISETRISVEGLVHTAIATILDTDLDTVQDEEDNCPMVPNADQTDTDGDGIGDACEGVGGVATLPDVSDSSGRNYMALVALAAAAVVALTASAWYARRRWLTQD